MKRLTATACALALCASMAHAEAHTQRQPFEGLAAFCTAVLGGGGAAALPAASFPGAIPVVVLGGFFCAILVSEIEAGNFP